MLIVNPGSLAKPLAIDQLIADVIAFNVSIVIIAETWFKPAKHNDSIVGLPGYVLYRRDRLRNKGGGVAIYLRSSIQATQFFPSCSRGPQSKEYASLEVVWVTFAEGGRDYYVCSIYHPPNPIYPTSNLLLYLESVTEEIIMGPALFPIILLAGDFNQLHDDDVLALGYENLVLAATHKGHKLDRLYVTQPIYSNVKVVKTSIAGTEHSAIVARVDNSFIEDINKQHTQHSYRQRAPAQCAAYLNSLSQIDWSIIYSTPSVDRAFDYFYQVMHSMLQQHFPYRKCTLSSRDPPFITPTIKNMLRRKNRLMRSGRLEQASSLALKIGQAITKTSTRVLRSLDKKNVTSRDLWKGVNQLVKKPLNSQSNLDIDASKLNHHYASISTDAGYEDPSPRATCCQPLAWPGEFLVFRALDSLKPTSPGPDSIPSWLYKLGAPYLAAPLATLYRLSLQTSTVPLQWKTAVITPAPKVHTPLLLSDFRPISQTPLLARIFERLLVRHYFYPIISDPAEPIHHSLGDQYAFRPTGSTTSAITAILHHATDMLSREPFVRLISFDFSKAFDTVRLSTLFSKLAQLPIPDYLYNWLIHFFTNRTHSTIFRGVVSSLLGINCSIVQGSVFGPTLFDINSSDLKPEHDSNVMSKYADDAYLLIPASASSTADSEVLHLSQWATSSNLRLNMAKCKELVITTRGREVVMPPLVNGIERVRELKILGVTMQHDLSMDSHVTNIQATASQSLYALRVLRAHGLQGRALHLVCRAYLDTRLTYAIPAWRGFANLGQVSKLQKIIDRAGRWGLDGGIKLPSLDQLADKADQALFHAVSAIDAHVLHHLLPPIRDVPYDLRDRGHNYQLAVSSNLLRRNFISRMLFLHAY